MGFRVLMAFAVFLIPGIMICFGRIMRDHPPKTINAAYGYRTAMSMICLLYTSDAADDLLTV